MAKYSGYHERLHRKQADGNIDATGEGRLGGAADADLCCLVLLPAFSACSAALSCYLPKVSCVLLPAAQDLPTLQTSIDLQTTRRCGPTAAHARSASRRPPTRLPAAPAAGWQRRPTPRWQRCQSERVGSGGTNLRHWNK